MLSGHARLAARRHITKFALQTHCNFGSLASWENCWQSRYCSWPLLACLRAQDQERKLVDRLLRPDMTLQSSEQKKKFIADGTSINKKASVGTFYVEKKSNSKTFSGTREFSTRQFNSQPFHGSRRAFENSSQQAVGNSRLRLSNANGSRSPRCASIRQKGCQSRIRREPAFSGSG